MDLTNTGYEHLIGAAYRVVLRTGLDSSPTARSYDVVTEYDIDPVRDPLIYIADKVDAVVATLKLARDLDPADPALDELLVTAASDALEALGHLQAMTGQER